MRGSQTGHEEGDLRRLSESGQSNKGTSDSSLKSIGPPGPSLGGVDLRIFESTLRLREARSIFANFLNSFASEGVLLFKAKENLLVGSNGGVARAGREGRVHSRVVVAADEVRETPGELEHLRIGGCRRATRVCRRGSCCSQKEAGQVEEFHGSSNLLSRDKSQYVWRCLGDNTEVFRCPRAINPL